MPKHYVGITPLIVSDNHENVKYKRKTAGETCVIALLSEK